MNSARQNHEGCLHPFSPKLLTELWSNMLWENGPRGL